MNKSMLKREARPTPVLRGFGYVFTLAVLMFGAPAVQATPADPQGVFDSLIAGIPVTPVDAFQFQANSNGGGVFNFQNVSGNDWIGMDFFVTLASNTPIACGPGPFFFTCEVTSTPTDTRDMALYDIGFDEPRGSGITNQAGFSFNLNDPVKGQPNLDPNGAGGWDANTVFNVVATSATPEPGSWLLFASGIALIGSILRFRSLQS